MTFLATTNDDFARHYRGLSPNGDEWRALDVWVKRDGVIHHFWAGEVGGTEDPGQHARGAPDPTPLWNILDLTPAGPGTDCLGHRSHQLQSAAYSQEKCRSV